MFFEELTDDPDEPSDDVATSDEVEAAIRALQASEQIKKRLNRAAAVILRTTSILRKTCEPQDLVQEALLGILSGRRKWRTNKVDFPGLVVGAMKSLAWSRNQTLENAMPRLVMESEMTPEGREDEASIVDMLAKDETTPETQVLTKESDAADDCVLALLRAQFEPNELAGLILDWMKKKQGYSDAEIRTSLDVSAEQYWNAKKALVRAAEKFGETLKGH
ncbi:hypothetical protein [Cupriavidus metallidurans]|uniref:hypothetical protein n=1 Tax=Cupriavidus metallidurans TaxID=119219 RepID=UPI0011406DBE|nr:hypothetical protein [Cupriavidus metallidurans]